MSLQQILDTALLNFATIATRKGGLKQRVINDSLSECKRVNALAAGSADRDLLELVNASLQNVQKFDKFMRAGRDFGLELRVQQKQHTLKLLI